MGKLLLVLIMVPLFETWFWIKMGGVIGALPTIALVILTAVVGGMLVRQQGFSTVNRLQQKMQAGQMPAEELFAGMLIVIAGVLLITPGFFTDALGFLCLFPPFRHWLAGAILRSGVIKFDTAMGGNMNGAGNDPMGGNMGRGNHRDANRREPSGTVIYAEDEIRDDSTKPPE